MMTVLIHYSNISVTGECLRRLQWHSNVVMGDVTVIINIVSTHCSPLERFGDLQVWSGVMIIVSVSCHTHQRRINYSPGQDGREPGRSTQTGENNLPHTEPGICLLLSVDPRCISVSLILPPPPLTLPSTDILCIKLFLQITTKS